jgi:Tol biopolymer transport system component
MKDNGGGNVEVRDLSKGSRGEVKVWQIFGQGGVHIPGSLLISPDGKQIAGSGMIGLSVMPNAAHSSSTLVKNGGRGEPGNGNPVGWSPDGTSLLIVGGRGAARGFRWLNIDDGLIRELGDFGPVDMEDGGPSLSPDGQFVAYSLRRTRETRQSPIYTATVNGSGKTPVVTPLVTDGLNSDPIWTPDGRRVLFIRESQGTAELWAVGVRDGKAAGAPSLILKNLGGIPVGITRDGVFYYAKQLPGSNRWVTVDMEAGGARIRGSALHVIGSLEGVPDGEANISPNGEFMVYNRGSLVIYSMETSKERVLDGVRGFRIAWLHDSSGFMQWRSDAGGSSLYRVDVASGNSTKLLHDDHPLGTSRPIAVSPDDKTVYSSLPNTTTNGSDIVAFNLSTGQVRTVHPNAEIIGYDIALAVSHDGRTLALNLRNGIARVGVDGTGFQALVSRTSELQSFSKAAWTADDQNILFAAELVDPLAGPTVARQQNSRIMRVAAAGGRPESTGIDVEGEIRSISLSGNGSRLVYALRNPESSEIWSIDLSSVLQQ